MSTIAARHIPTSTDVSLTRNNEPSPISEPSPLKEAESSSYSKKRRIYNDDDGLHLTKEAVNDSRTLKQAENTNSMLTTVSNTESHIQFLMVHFNILKALYRDDDHTENSDNHLEIKLGTPSGEYPKRNIGVVDAPVVNAANIWNHIQSFIMYQRESLLHVQQQIDHVSNIHQAALEYCRTSTDATNSVATMNNRNNTNYIPERDHSHRKSTSSMHTVTNDSFRIIANIIGQQSKMIQQQKQVPSIAVLQQLLQVVTKRIESLQVAYTKIYQQPQHSAKLPVTTSFINDHNDHKDMTAVPKRSRTMYNERSYRTELQYKMHLWSLLAHDLKEVLRS